MEENADRVPRLAAKTAHTCSSETTQVWHPAWYQGGAAYSAPLVRATQVFSPKAEASAASGIGMPDKLSTGTTGGIIP